MFALHQSHLNAFLASTLKHAWQGSGTGESVAWQAELSGLYTAISRKVIGKTVHATIPKGNMGYDQFSIFSVIWDMINWDMIHFSWHCSCRTYFHCFPLALANIRPWPLLPLFEISLKNSELKTTHNTFGIVACTFSDNLPRNSCTSTAQTNLSFSAL